jgi:transposase-like protein
MYMRLLDIVKNFQTQEDCIKYLEATRWKNGVVCPFCNGRKTCKHVHGHQCWECKRSFSVTVKTIFHDTKVPLLQWFLLMALMQNAKKGLSACQAARDLGMRRPTVWSMMHRIRAAMKTEQKDLLCGIIEMDECYVGGKPKKSSDDNDDAPRGRGTRKEAVVGMVARNGKVNVNHVAKSMLNGEHLIALVRKSVSVNDATLITDEYRAYSKMHTLVKHKQINHSYEYARKDGDFNVHSNTIEGFWSLLKRGIVGQFHKVSAHYLSKYLDEFEYRYNQRTVESSLAFNDLMGRMVNISV